MGTDIKPIKKKPNSCLILLIIALALSVVTIIGIILAVTISTSEKSSETSTEQEGPKVGDSLSELSHKEIVDEYKAQKKISELAAQNYLTSLEDKEIIWIGVSSDVRADCIDGKEYMVISFAYGLEGLFDTNLVYANLNDNMEYQKIPDMTLIKISGSIDKVELFLKVGINVYIKDIVIEIIEYNYSSILGY